MSSNRQFLENVWKLLGISSSNGSTINSCLEFLRKLKVLTENFQMFSSRKNLISSFDSKHIPVTYFFHRIYTYFSKITETFS